MAELLYINGSGTNPYGQLHIGQSITPDDDWSIDSIEISAFYVGVAGDAYCDIYLASEVDGKPTGSSLGTSDANPCIGPPDGQTETFTWSTSVLLSTGVTYWFVFSKPGDTVASDRGNVPTYDGGSVGYGVLVDPTTWWSIDGTGYDFTQFKVFGTIGLTPSQEIYLSNVSMRGLDT